MAFLAGLKDYLSNNYRNSIFEHACASRGVYCLHLHGALMLRCIICADSTYDVSVKTVDGDQRELQKTQIKMLYPEKFADQIQAQLNINENLRARELAPIVTAKQRNHIKNKSLFTLMRAQEVLTVTLLEGEILQGRIGAFSQYEITLNVKDQTPVTVLRHAIFNICSPDGHCFLKAKQQALRDWTKSPLYIDPRPRSQLRPGLKKSKIKRRQKIIIR